MRFHRRSFVRCYLVSDEGALGVGLGHDLDFLGRVAHHHILKFCPGAHLKVLLLQYNLTHPITSKASNVSTQLVPANSIPNGWVKYEVVDLNDAGGFLLCASR